MSRLPKEMVNGMELLPKVGIMVSHVIKMNFLFRAQFEPGVFCLKLPKHHKILIGRIKDISTNTFLK
jgi:hypothetical protein